MPNNYVFINFPYDKYYEPLFLALIAGLCGLGLTPKCTLQISPREYRLKRILSLINKCRFSLHDLSRVESPIPRFNMPFEAGLAIAYSRYNKAHEWRILEAKKTPNRKDIKRSQWTRTIYSQWHHQWNALCAYEYFCNKEKCARSC